jgi:hypothetical protein
VRVDASDVFVVLKWPAQAGYPPYSFATAPHAAEMQAQAGAERVQTCASIEAAASAVDRLNAEHKSAAA